MEDWHLNSNLIQSIKNKNLDVIKHQGFYIATKCIIL